MNHARWEIVEDTADCLCIRDIGPWNVYLTVTNDAEWVVERLAARLAGRRLEYYDSQGNRDRLLVENGRFAGYAPVRKGHA
jgi:hypothetical protein